MKGYLSTTRPFLILVAVTENKRKRERETRVLYGVYIEWIRVDRVVEHLFTDRSGGPESNNGERPRTDRPNRLYHFTRNVDSTEEKKKRNRMKNGKGEERQAEEKKNNLETRVFQLASLNAVVTRPGNLHFLAWSQRVCPFSRSVLYLL